VDNLPNPPSASNSLNTKNVLIPLIAVLDDVRSMHNVGSIFRSADAFGIQAVWLSGITARPPHRDIRKTALGADETVEWEYYESIENAIEKLKANGYCILAIEQTESSTELGTFRIEKTAAYKGYAIILGNEVKGVSKHALTQANHILEIPQYGNKKSLNISVAGGVSLYELSRKIRITT
jgi:23S rRNA (guanosine2251-2'-O)-methyltransferase